MRRNERNGPGIVARIGDEEEDEGLATPPACAELAAGAAGAASCAPADKQQEVRETATRRQERGNFMA